MRNNSEADNSTTRRMTRSQTKRMMRDTQPPRGVIHNNQESSRKLATRVTIKKQKIIDKIYAKIFKTRTNITNIKLRITKLGLESALLGIKCRSFEQEQTQLEMYLEKAFLQ
ncbi:hypothetical protein DOLIC_00067 [Dolichomitus sp. PSUC_FEM 10030005]|nr:hypothetical protein [Dolichomitus sp. PSUC_FEM 10030005]